MTKSQALQALRAALHAYCPLDEVTWEGLAAICTLLHLDKGEPFTRAGQVPSTFGFVGQGLLRVFVTDAQGREYNKVFFAEGGFPGAMAALLTHSASAFAIQALEPSWLLGIDFKAYRQLLRERDDLKWFQILYLEKNWLLEAERREVALVQEDARQRYLNFRTRYPDLERRIPQYHIASHLGITPTQLSRIRKTLAGN